MSHEEFRAYPSPVGAIEFGHPAFGVEPPYGLSLGAFLLNNATAHAEYGC